MKTKTQTKNLKERGITLIALVITIIVLLILAGVTLNIVLNDNLIGKSENAVDRYKFAQQQEKEYLESVETQLYQISGTLDNTNGTEHRTITGADPAYNNPIIPVGFKTVNTGSASWKSLDGETVLGWNNGLVIEDESGNQFVWVPVNGKVIADDDTTTERSTTVVDYAKWCTTNISYADCSTDPSEMPVTIEQESKMITKYQGFYVGRFEASKDEDNPTKAASKKNVAPWTDINYTNSSTYAKALCNTDYVKSGLLTGRMWDTTMRWFEIETPGCTTDSRSWGNHSNSTSPANVSGYGGKQNTGYSEYWKKKNIYDMAGNVLEWTYESYNTSHRMVRGGVYWHYGNKEPAAFLDDFDPTYTSRVYRF